MQDITDNEYNHMNNIYELFHIKNVGEYHDLYVKSDTILLKNMASIFIKTMYN